MNFERKAGNYKSPTKFFEIQIFPPKIATKKKKKIQKQPTERSLYDEIGELFNPRVTLLKKVF